MNDSFSIHDWQLKRNLEEYRHLLEPVPGPISDQEVIDIWDRMRDKQSLRGDVIANAAPTADQSNKNFNWEDLTPELQGAVTGYFNNNPKEFYYYKGYLSAR